MWGERKKRVRAYDPEGRETEGTFAQGGESYRVGRPLQEGRGGMGRCRGDDGVVEPLSYDPEEIKPIATKKMRGWNGDQKHSKNKVHSVPT